MYVLGIVGGVASGKSAVSQAFARRGAAVLDADHVGHQVLAEPEVIAAFRQRWGEAVVGVDGQIIRRQVAARVFGQSEEAAREREFLNSVSHPRIRARLRDQLEELRSGNTQVAIIDAALLFETGWDELCDGIVFVAASRLTRYSRAQERGWSAKEFSEREVSQLPVDEKMSRANWVIQNDGVWDSLEPQVECIWKQIVTEA